MTDLGNKLMESMFDAWCDDECKEFTRDHNDYGHSLPLPDKLAIAFSDEEPVELLDRIAKIDFEARKLVYQYLKLMLAI